MATGIRTSENIFVVREEGYCKQQGKKMLLNAGFG
jgi:hypothetical protein